MFGFLVKVTPSRVGEFEAVDAVRFVNGGGVGMVDGEDGRASGFSGIGKFCPVVDLGEGFEARGGGEKRER